MKEFDNKSSNIALIGILFSLSIALSVLESLLPTNLFLPVGVKLGLSNVVVVYTLCLIGSKNAFIIAVLKSLFVLITRSPIGALISFSGGVFSIFVMLLLVKTVYKERKNYVIISIWGAMSHNLGQLIAAAFFMNTLTVIYQLPLLLLFGFLMGIITGTVLKIVLPYISKLSLYLKGGF